MFGGQEATSSLDAAAKYFILPSHMRLNEVATSEVPSMVIASAMSPSCLVVREPLFFEPHSLFLK